MVDTSVILIATLLSIAAALFVARGKAFIANCIWSVTNIVIMLHSYSIGEFEMVALFGAYEVIAIYGVYHLGAKRYVTEYMFKKRISKIIEQFEDIIRGK
jgi:hypothetical protein